MLVSSQAIRLLPFSLAKMRAQKTETEAAANEHPTHTPLPFTQYEWSQQAELKNIASTTFLIHANDGVCVCVCV